MALHRVKNSSIKMTIISCGASSKQLVKWKDSSMLAVDSYHEGNTPSYSYISARYYYATGFPSRGAESEVSVKRVQDNIEDTENILPVPKGQCQDGQHEEVEHNP